MEQGLKKITGKLYTSVGMSEKDIKTLKKTAFNKKDTFVFVENMIGLRSLGIEPFFISEIKKMYGESELIRLLSEMSARYFASGIKLVISEQDVANDFIEAVRFNHNAKSKDLSLISKGNRLSLVISGLIDLDSFQNGNSENK